MPTQDKGGTSATQGRSETRTSDRVPMGGRQKRLVIANKDPNYFYYFFRDLDDTIFRAKQAGYREISYREAGQQVPEGLPGDPKRKPTDPYRQHGGRDDGGARYDLVAMKLPMELRREDEARLAAQADAIDSAIMRPEFKDGRVINNQYADISVTMKDTE
jgi:hypothetical protein